MIILFIILIVLQIIDVYTTFKCLTSGIGVEANPLMKWLFDKIGLIVGLLLPKIIIFGSLGYSLFGSQSFDNNDKIYGLIVLLCVIFYAYIVRNNIRILTEYTPK